MLISRGSNAEDMAVVSLSHIHACKPRPEHFRQVKYLILSKAMYRHAWLRRYHTGERLVCQCVSRLSNIRLPVHARLYSANHATDTLKEDCTVCDGRHSSSCAMMQSPHRRVHSS